MRQVCLNFILIMSSAIPQWSTCLWCILGSVSSLRGNFKMEGVVERRTVTGGRAVFSLPSTRLFLLWGSAATLVL